MKKLSIIVPVYNEESSIETLLERVTGISISDWSSEIIVVDDGSTDKTTSKLKKWEKRVRVIYQKNNAGKGSAVSSGLLHATGDVILIQDADLEYSPDDYPILLAPFDNPRVSVVYGSRFLGTHLSTMFVYEVGNKFVTFLTNLLYNTNITDMETGYKVFRKEVIRGMNLTAKRFDFEPEFTAKVLRRGYQILEVPISYFGRTFKEGKKLTWKDGILAVWTLIRCRI